MWSLKKPSCILDDTTVQLSCSLTFHASQYRGMLFICIVFPRVSCNNLHTADEGQPHSYADDSAPSSDK